MTAIKFGTSGHRGIVGQEFTTKHVQAISLAVADLLLAKNKHPRIVLGCDPRKGNDPKLGAGSFTKTIVDILISKGVMVDVFDSFAPTPLVSWYIRKYGLDGGLILTASHNPPEYNGIKFNPGNGAPAPSEVTQELELKANQYYDREIKSLQIKDEKINFINKNQEFAEDLIKNITKFCQLEKGALNFPVVVDAKHGTATSIWEEIFKILNIKKYKIINAEPKADFGGIEANPTKISSLTDLKNKQKAFQAPIAIANDPDADRHVILDENGDLVTPEEVCVIVLDYLVNKNIPVLGIASTVASSNLIKTACTTNGLEYAETAVGFKYFAPFLEKGVQENKIALAVESSGGISASFHILEKCGYLPGVLLMGILADTGQKLSELKTELAKKYGKYYFKEDKYEFEATKKVALVNFFREITKENLKTKFKDPISLINKTDGVKVEFENGDWFLFRLSGTEPMARVYAETQSEQQSDELVKQAKQIITFF